MRFLCVAYLMLIASAALSMHQTIKEEYQTAPVIAFDRLYYYIHTNDTERFYDYLENIYPRGGWPYVLNEFSSRSGLSLLQRALVQTPRPNSAIIAGLLRYGADPNAPILRNIVRRRFNQGRFYKGWTAAHIAVRVKADQRVFKLLTSYGCNFQAKDAQGWNPSMVAHADKKKKKFSTKSR